MKNIFKILFISTIVFLFANCSSDDTTTIDNRLIIKQIEDTIKSGTWRITSYMDSGQNETSDYTGYQFAFNDNGNLEASNGTNTINGTWSITDDSNSNDDDSNNDNDIDFNISFTSPANFEELSDDWDIVYSNSSKISLIDVSGGNGGTDTLVFEKN